VVIEPLAHLFPGETLQWEVETAGAGAVVTVAPDTASLRAFGPDLYDPASWNPAYRAGLGQATAVADEIRAQWAKEGAP
jgi:NTE family protein